MSFAYRTGVLCAEDVPLEDIAERYGTPCYVYSRTSIERAYAEYEQALRGRNAMLCYSVKANSSLAILALLAQFGAGFDIVSAGELARVIAAGGDPGRTLFSGVGKSVREIEYALEKGIGCINVESEAELMRVDTVARRLKKRAAVALRVNPDIDAGTHPYISTGLRDNKFGIAHGEAERLYEVAARLPGIEVAGVGCHIGSQLVHSGPYAEAAARMGLLAQALEARGIGLKHIDIGGGIGIRYRDEEPEPVASFVASALARLEGRKEKLILDPGRSIVGNAGVLLTRVEYVKQGATRNFLVVDAAMNDLLRPALYGAWHDIQPARESDMESGLYDIVGPVCESADFIGQERTIAAREGDVLAVMSAGAYGMAMSSNYNSRPRAAEVLVAGGEAHLIRERESVAQLFALERIPG